MRYGRSGRTAATVLLALCVAAALAPALAPQNALDPAAWDILDAGMAPAWAHPFGTDQQGRDILSAVLYGLRVSLAVSVLAVALSCALGSLLGAIAGTFGGWIDAAIMRAADLQLAFPALLLSLLVDGAANAVYGPQHSDGVAFWTVTLSISLSFWAQYARAVRASTLAEAGKDYVLAARLSGMAPARLVTREIMPNVAASIVPIAAVNLSGAIVAEATLSFLGVGMSANVPSLGTLLRVGNDYLVAQWWMAAFPAAVLAALAISATVLGDEL